MISTPMPTTIEDIDAQLNGVNNECVLLVTKFLEV